MRDKRKTLTDNKRASIVALYRENIAIKVISDSLSVSTATIYAVLREEGVQKRSKEYVAKIGISLDEESLNIINRAKPDNISRFVCDAIKLTYGDK